MAREAPELVQLVEQLRISANIPPPATNFHTMQDAMANIYVFDTKPGVQMVYRYDVEIVEQHRQKSLTKGGGDDGKKGLLREICYQLVKATFERTNGGNVLFVYDNRKILFTNKRVDAMKVEIKPEQMSDFCRRYLYNASVTLELHPCRLENAHELNLNDIRRALQPSPNVQADHSLRTFLEMLSSQAFINAGSHKIVGPGRLFENKPVRRINAAITTHNGIAKGVRIIVNGDVKPCPALVADVKTCAFYVAGNLEQIANEMIQNAQQRRRLDPNNAKQMEGFWSDFGQLYKGVSANLTYAPSRVIVIDSITTRTCAEVTFDVDGTPMTMVEFFRIKKDTNINPRMPAVRQHVDRDSMYPLACLQILPLQRLGLDKMSLNEEMASISQELLRANSVTPEVRYKAIEEEMRKIGAPSGDCAKFMMAFNVRLKGARNDVLIGKMQLPPIMYGANRQQNQDDRGRFDVRGPVRYLETSNMLRSWMVAHPRKVEEGQYDRFLKNLMDMANQRGMHLPPPSYDLLEANQMEDKMKKYAADKIQFLFYIDYKYMKSHAQLKLFEKRYSVLTQHVTIEMIQKAGQASVSNVLNKTNMKLFGLNYIPLTNPAFKAKLDISTGNVLIIGIDTSRPTAATAFEIFQMRKKGMTDIKSEDPMVVGMSANFLKNPLKFAGDYYYQPCKQDMLNPEFLMQKMTWLLNQLKANRPQAPPKIVFIIRDGVSEGMIPKLLANDGEYRAFVEACKKFSPSWQPKFVYCIVDKRHNKRFFAAAQPSNGNGNGGNGNGNGNGNGFKAANTGPGSVIDRKFVRVDMHEFFLQSHFPLKGVSKIPQYAFPVNEIKADNNELEAFIHYLCNMWQIVGLSPALPSPVLQAKELAKRGRNNYVDFKRNMPQSVPRLPAPQGQGQVLDVARLNAMLSYSGGSSAALTLTRFNA